MGLGSLDTWTLAEARDRARQQRQLLDQGLDPIDARQTREAAAAIAQAQTMSFEQCAKDCIRDRRAGWKNAKHAEQWTSTLETWAYPIIGKLSVGGITTDLVLKVLKTASRVRGRIVNVLD
jgi:hypothetical protein